LTFRIEARAGEWTLSMGKSTRSVACVLALASGLAACTYTSRAVEPPDAAEIESSTLYAADGTLVHTFHAEENRKVIPLERIPEHVREAVIAIEDERFYRHNGVDPRAILRAARANAESGDASQGGSTITQQYVKQEILKDDSPTFERKIQEASTAIQLERTYSKDRILELYLNAIYFGNGAYGVEAAAHQYFGKSATDLRLDEGAMIAGLIQRPGDADPFDDPEAALDRRRLVLERMASNDMISDDVALYAANSPLKLASAVVPAAERYPAAYFVEEVKQWILDDPRFGATAKERRDLLFGGGLKIHTTVDLAMQAQAEAAVAAILPDPNGPDASLVAIEGGTGHVRAMVGGRDFFGTSSIAKLNLATQARRQAGSSFKPLVLATALTQGMSPLTRISAPACISIPDTNPPWRPCNYGGGGGGTVTIAEGTVRSYNTLYAQLVMRVGPEEAMEGATRYGIMSPLQKVPSGVLGSNGVTAMDMAAAYSTFANRGIKVPPVLVTRITRSDGTVLYSQRHQQTKVLEAGVVDTLTSILEQAVQRGTGTRAKLADRAVAGKTGTTDDNKDAWFAGYTPQLATAVWVGFPEVGANKEVIPMRPPATPFAVTGGSYPAQIWQHFMSAALAGRPALAFHAPTTTTTVPRFTSVTTGQAALQAVPGVVGLPVARAIAILDASGFVVVASPAAASRQSPGMVAVQAPAAGSLAPRGATVTLEVTS
jgi:penicillin-binding protein 1A